ncbi:MAG: hypothetical protein Q4B68_05595 [Bacteroidales bacterium]|nr:hypothetical protein [Bacteroidales bacterium]
MALHITIQDELSKNGSPRATFETDDDRLCFVINIPAHKAENRENVSVKMELSKDNALYNKLLHLINQHLSQDLSQDVYQAIEKLKAPESLRIVTILLLVAQCPVKLGQLQKETTEKNRSRFVSKYIKPLLALGWLQRTIPDKPTSKNQAYHISSIIANMIQPKN